MLNIGDEDAVEMVLRDKLVHSACGKSGGAISQDDRLLRGGLVQIELTVTEDVGVLVENRWDRSHSRKIGVEILYGDDQIGLVEVCISDLGTRVEDGLCGVSIVA